MLKRKNQNERTRKENKLMKIALVSKRLQPAPSKNRKLNRLERLSLKTIILSKNKDYRNQAAQRWSNSLLKEIIVIY